MSSLLARFWSLRQSPNSNERLIWWLVVIGGPLAVLIPAFFQVQLFLVAWYMLALLLCIVPVVWGFYHRQALWEAMVPARNWAGGLSLLNTLVLYSTMKQTGQWQSLELLTVAIIAFAFTVVFLCALILQLVGAAIGIMAGAGLADLGAAAKRGTHAWGLGVLFLAFLPGLQTEGFRLFLKASVPITTLILCLLARTPELDPHGILMRWVHLLERRLILRWDRDRAVLFFDFRGAALGVLAGVMAILMSVTGVFVPMQMQTLVPLIRLRNSNDSFKLAGTASRAETDAQQIVLVQFDPSTRSGMLTDGSETAVQAATIRRLSQLEVAAIVLPMPLLESSWLDMRRSGNIAGDYEAPEPDGAEIARAREGVPDLVRAIKDSGRVIIAAHRGITGTEAGSLISAADGVGDAMLAGYRVRSNSVEHIKSIPTVWVEHPPLPYLLAARLQPVTWKLPATPGNLAVHINIPEAADPVIVSYQSTERDREFPRTTYSSLLQKKGDRIYVIPPQPTAQSYPKDRSLWLREPGYFKDKIVFLDSIAWDDQPTPIGALGMPELTAHATMTLTNRSFIQKAGLLSDFLITILFGLLAGHLCLRRDPFNAAWRIGLATIILVAGVSLTFLLRLTWIDPVLPLIAAVIAFMLVTQFTFSLEHVALQRNRALLQRFVAPQVVEELLEDPENKLGLGGRRQRICVLFADVRNFTPYAEQHTSEEVIETINAYMTALTEALHAYGGILDKYTGDGLMAMFRITEDPPDDEIQEAVLAALAMRDVAKSVSRRLEEQEKEALGVGISMHYGEAVVGLVGNPNQFNYTALGHTVVVAARLNTVAQPGDVLVSDSVFQAIAETFTVEECEEVMVKGLSQPVRPYRVIKAHRLTRKTRVARLLSSI
jgi:class 3 adenylate cyclase